MELIPIKNHIIFQFIDKIDNKGQFIEDTAWGFHIPGHFDNSAKSPRWVNVISVGPEVEKVKVGQQALVHTLMWSFPFNFQGGKFWRTDESKIVATRNTPKGAMRVLGDYVIFEKVEQKKSTSGLHVIGNVGTDTPVGKVLQIGPKTDPELDGSTIYYDNANFFNNFKHKDVKLCYIEEVGVLAYEPSATKE